MPIPTPQALDHWQQRRSRLRVWWWIYLLISIAGAVVFIRNLQARDPYTFAILLLIPLLALRQAWKTDRQISACDHHIRQITTSAVPPLAPASELGKKCD